MQIFCRYCGNIIDVNYFGHDDRAAKIWYTCIFCYILFIKNVFLQLTRVIDIHSFLILYIFIYFLLFYPLFFPLLLYFSLLHTVNLYNIILIAILCMVSYAESCVSQVSIAKSTIKTVLKNILQLIIVIIILDQLMSKFQTHVHKKYVHWPFFILFCNLTSNRSI